MALFASIRNTTPEAVLEAVAQVAPLKHHEVRNDKVVLRFETPEEAKQVFDSVGATLGLKWFSGAVDAKQRSRQRDFDLQRNYTDLYDKIMVLTQRLDFLTGKVVPKMERQISILSGMVDNSSSEEETEEDEVNTSSSESVPASPAPAPRRTRGRPRGKLA